MLQLLNLLTYVILEVGSVFLAKNKDPQLSNNSQMVPKFILVPVVSIVY